MTDPDPFEERLTRSLGDRVAQVRAAADTASVARSLARRRRRRTATVGGALAVVVVAVGAAAVGIGSGSDPAPAAGPAETAPAQHSSSTSPGAPSPTGTTSPGAAPGECVPAIDVTRTDLGDDPGWVRFCAGRRGLTAPAEVPSDALTTHLDLLDDLAQTDSAADSCRSSFGRTYRLQIGYPDGTVAEVSGHTDPGCAGRVRGGASVIGADGLGVYGAVMAAFGQQYADDFDAVRADVPLACPGDPREPDSVDLDGASDSLDTGYLYGERSPMVMPLAAVRGIVCTWPAPGSGSGPGPAIDDLTPEQAERVRIGLHAVENGMVDCGGSPDPTYTAVVEDKTGTRRAVTIIDSECSTVIRSKDGYGLGFAWLDR